MQRAGLGGGEPGVGGDLAGGAGQELHQAVRVGRRDGVGQEEALLADQRDDQQRIEPACPRLALDDGPEAQGIEEASRRVVRVGAGAACRQQGGAGSADGAEGLRDQQPGRVVGNRIELAPREAQQSERRERAGARRMRTRELLGEHRRRRCHDVRRGVGRDLSGPPGCERAIVGCRLLARERPQCRVRARVLEQRADASGPVLGGRAAARRAVVGDAGEVARGLREIAGEVPDPPGTPAGFARHGRPRLLAREPVVDVEGFVVTSRFLVDAADRVARFRRVARGGEAGGELAIEPERRGIVVGVPSPAGRRGERLRAERVRQRRDLEARGLRVAALAKGALGARADPERLRPLVGFGRRAERRARLEGGRARVLFAEQELALGEVRRRGLEERRCAGPDARRRALGASQRDPAKLARARGADQLERLRVVALLARHVGERQRRGRPARALRCQALAGRHQPPARAVEVVVLVSEPARQEARARYPDRVREALAQGRDTRDGQRVVAGASGFARFQVQHQVTQFGPPANRCQQG